jgi:hypothetical protein
LTAARAWLLDPSKAGRLRFRAGREYGE